MSSYVTRKTPGDTSWFTHDRFGMFIHWGLYALPARHEWVKSYECLTDKKYQQYFDHFDPDMYDPKDWARRAKEAGMRYAVMTAKHHEGFCMWDSKYTDYKCTNTKAGRDLLKEYVEAFRNEGIHVGIYYSLIDWHHPDFTLDHQHPRRKDSNPEEYDKGRDMHRYAEYMRNQVTELLTNYGKIDVMWFDFSYDDVVLPEFPHLKGKGKLDWEAEQLIATARAIQPDIIIDNRTGIEQDIWTPEQYAPKSWQRHSETNELVVWESGQTFSGSWGYYRDEMSWKSPEMLIQLLINMVSNGGNMIMNVGPTARGYLDYRAEAALKVYADWMKYNSRSIYGCTMAEPELLALCPNGCRFTQSEDGKRLYIHIIEYPYNYLEIPGLAGKVEYAQFLHDGSEILYDEGELKHFAATEGTKINSNFLAFRVPVIKPPVVVPVIEVFLK